MRTPVEPIRLRDMAARVHLSDRQLTRRFLETLGRTPGDWLVRERLRRAQELLERTDFTIDTVAARCGYTTAAGLRPRSTGTCVHLPATTASPGPRSYAGELGAAGARCRRW